MKKLAPEFYRDNVLSVAQKLIGCFLIRDCGAGRIIGRINEVEAYDGAIDKACHAYNNKRTARNEPLFRGGGIAHVYFIYGMYNCLNIVTGVENCPEAVLLRGVDVVDNLELAVHNRYGRSMDEVTKQQMKNLSNGPGKLCRALAVDRTFDYESLQSDRLYICEQIGAHARKVQTIVASRRIGIDYAEEAIDFLWRFTD